MASSRKPLAAPDSTEGETLGGGLKFSLIAHLLLALLVIIKNLVFPGTPLPYIPTLRVDLVALPDLLKKDIQDLPSLPETTPDPPAPAQDHPKTAEESPAEKTPAFKSQPKAPENEVALKPKPSHIPPSQPHPPDLAKKNRSALARLKAFDKIKGFANEEDAHLNKSQIHKGNKLSKGTSTSGDAKEATAANYLDTVRDWLKRNWSLPVWIARQNYAAQVQLYIDSNGYLKTFAFYKPSGNTQFDDAVKKAIQVSQPFPAPPEEIQGTLRSHGILVGFPL